MKIWLLVLTEETMSDVSTPKIKGFKTKQAAKEALLDWEHEKINSDIENITIYNYTKTSKLAFIGENYWEKAYITELKIK